MTLWVFAESAPQARKWLDENAPEERARIWSGGATAPLNGIRFSAGDRVVIVGDVGPAADAMISRCAARSPANTSIVRAL